MQRCQRSCKTSRGTHITVDGKKAHFHARGPNDLKARWDGGNEKTHLKFINVSYSASQGKVTMNSEAVYEAKADLGRDALIAAKDQFQIAIAAKILEKFVK